MKRKFSVSIRETPNLRSNKPGQSMRGTTKLNSSIPEEPSLPQDSQIKQEDNNGVVDDEKQNWKEDMEAADVGSTMLVIETSRNASFIDHAADTYHSRLLVEMMWVFLE